MKSIYLSPSTQERNIGVGSYGSEEKRCNEIADIVQSELKRHKIKIYRNNPAMSLSQIVNDSNNKDPDFHFAIHTNAFNKKSRGCEVFCHKKGGNGEKFANIIYKRISAITPTGDRGVKEGYNFYNGKPMYETCYTHASAVLIEIDFHDNLESAAWLTQNKELIGTELAKGILEYFNIPYIQKDSNLHYYRVVAGSYSSKENAENQVEKLKKYGFDSFILRT